MSSEGRSINDHYMPDSAEHRPKDWWAIFLFAVTILGIVPASLFAWVWLIRAVTRGCT